MKVVSSIGAAIRGLGLGGVQNLLLGGGALMICHGVARIYAPAGEILAGTFAIAMAWLLARAAR